MRNIVHYFFPHPDHVHKHHFFKKPVIAIIVALLALLYCLYTISVTNSTIKSFLIGSVIHTVLTEETNAVRDVSHVPHLTIDPLLSKAAQQKADDMVTRGYFAHTSPDGKTPWYWLEQMHYNYSYAGENLAVNFDESKDVVDAWVHSPQHYENLINPAFTNVGFGIAEGEFNGAKTTFVVQLFATPEREPVINETPIVVSAEPSDTKTFSETPQAIPEDSINLRTFEQGNDLETALAEIPHQATVLSETTTQPQPEIASPTFLESFLQLVTTSPRTTMYTILLSLLALISLLLVLHFFIHAKIPHTEVLWGSVTLAGVSIAMILAIHAASSPVWLPSDNENASVVSAIQLED